MSHHTADTNAIPLFWPTAAATRMGAATWDLLSHNLRFLKTASSIDHPLPPQWETPNTVLLSLDTMQLRDFSAPEAAGLPVLVEAPYAGHGATIADFGPGQSLVRVLLDHGLQRVYVTDWHSATRQMRDFNIDKYLAELNVVIDELGGRAVIVGLCQGGWMAAMMAARFPHKVAALVLAGSPMDTQAGNGSLKKMANRLGKKFYRDLVAAGDGRMLGRYMLAGWKNMHPDKQYLEKYLDLYERLDDPDYIAKTEHFARWYETAVDLPGRYYLQAIEDLFLGNQFAKGEFIGLGKRLSLQQVCCPTYLLAGEADDITPSEQVFAARTMLGTPPSQIRSQLVPGGHIGLFMGSHAIQHAWPGIAQWLVDQTGTASTAQAGVTPSDKV